MLLFAILGFLVIVSIVTQLQHWSAKRKLRFCLKEQYGKKPDQKKRKFYLINQYWKEFSNRIDDEEKLDEITWNDLEMDKIFNRINSCCSYIGEQVLFSRLHQLPKSDEVRNAFDKKVQFFDDCSDEREEVQMIMSGLGREYYSYDFPSFIRNIELNRIPRIWIYKAMQYVFLLTILISIVLRQPMFFLITGIVFGINLLLYTVGKMKYEVSLDMLKCITGVVDAGKKMSNKKKYAYENEFMDLSDAVAPFKKISSVISMLNFKKELAGSGDVLGLFYDYLIGATLWDFVKYDDIVKTLKNKQKEFVLLYELIGEIDSAISVASFRASLSNYCVPIFTEEHILRMSQVYHPLIDEPVCNDSELNRGSIITGSNASGKSTFIKATALNVILAQNINTCMGQEVVLPYAKVITSMAVRDDLISGESYYIKEIKYLKRIIDDLKDDRLVICAIDEILRGTNTEERIAASASVLRYLSDKNCMVIVASHDVELTQILDDIYDNYHFTEKMESKDIIFDYKIYSGASNSKNAIKLLEYIGFPDEIISEAVQMSQG
jgi:hypothetical protein